jgi:hypothetical protein
LAINITGRVHHFPITQLVRKFYEYVLPYTDGYQPLIARALWGLRQAVNVQPDPKALVYSIAVETLVAACFPNIFPVDPLWRKEVEKLQQQIASDETLPARLRTRGSQKTGRFDQRTERRKNSTVSSLPYTIKVRPGLRF